MVNTTCCLYSQLPPYDEYFETCRGKEFPMECSRVYETVYCLHILCDELFFGSVKYSLLYDKSVTGSTRLQGSLVMMDVYGYVHNVLVVYL
jgi:hypothetical protein